MEGVDMAFTDKSIAALKAKKQRYTVWVSHQWNELYVRRSARTVQV